MKRIICIGNRYIQWDATGPEVYDRLLSYALPSDVEVVDGGLAGLDLLWLIEDADRVVFVDNVWGIGQPNEIVLLEAEDVASMSGERYDHSAGLPYLLRVLPEVCNGMVPQILLVGIEGYPHEETIGKAAALAMRIAVENSSRITRL